MTNMFKRIRGDQQGAAIVEFAVVLLPLLLFLMGGLDLGYQAYLQSVVQGALNDVSRTGSLEAPSFECTGDRVEDKIRCAIETRSNVVARNATYRINLRSFYDFSGIGRSEKLVDDHNLNGRYDPGDCFIDLNENLVFDESAGRDDKIGGADDVVFYEVNLSMPRLFPIHQLIDVSPNYEIVATSAIRSQPSAVQKSPPMVCP